MDIFIEPIGRLINQFSKLPGVGKKTAQRYAYKVIGMTEAEAKEFAESILNWECLDRIFRECLAIRRPIRYNWEQIDA